MPSDAGGTRRELTRNLEGIMSGIRQTLRAAAILAALSASAIVLAHPMTLKGTVAAVERTRIQVKTGAEKKGETPEWCAIDDKTRIFRDKTAVTFEAAKIVVSEKVVVLTDHGSDNRITAVEIHLAAK
jgi:hypothetical protein